MFLHGTRHTVLQYDYSHRSPQEKSKHEDCPIVSSHMNNLSFLTKFLLNLQDQFDYTKIFQHRGQRGPQSQYRLEQIRPALGNYSIVSSS